MNFNIYLDDETGRRLSEAAEARGETRNAVIRHAIGEWLDHQGQAGWPDEVLNFRGMADVPLFEASRDKLTPPPLDPLA